MPYARRPRPSVRPRRTRRIRRRFTRQKRSRLYRSIRAPLPNKMLVKLKYADRSKTMNPGPGGLGYLIFSANGMYDPDISGIGHQPRGYDQLMTMYDHYTVVGSKLTAVFTPQSSVANTRNNAVVALALKDSNSPAGDMNDYIEGRNVTFKHFGLTTQGSSNVVSLSKTYSTRKFLGFTHPLSSTATRGNLSANPSEQGYFHIAYETQDPTIDPVVMNCTIYIEYIAILTEPKQPNQS